MKKTSIFLLSMVLFGSFSVGLLAEGDRDLDCPKEDCKDIVEGVLSSAEKEELEKVFEEVFEDGVVDADGVDAGEEFSPTAEEEIEKFFEDFEVFETLQDELVDADGVDSGEDLLQEESTAEEEIALEDSGPTVEPEPTIEPVEQPSVVQPSIIPLLSEKQQWQFINDELLLGPAYAMAFFGLPVKFLGAVGALWAMGSHGLAVPFGLKKRSRAIGSSLMVRPWMQAVRGKFYKAKDKTHSEKYFSGFATKALFAIGALAGYKLSGWAMESFLYGIALRGFLLKYPMVNRDKTPEALRPYFDAQYELFLKDGMKYIVFQTKKVIKFTRMAWKMNKRGIALSL